MQDFKCKRKLSSTLKELGISSEDSNDIKNKKIKRIELIKSWIYFKLV